MAKTRGEDKKNKPSSAATEKTVSNSNQEKVCNENVMQKVKKRNWAFVIYPESLPTNWLDILRTSGLSISISPLHDKDVNADGTPKKPHYHVIAVYGSPTTFNNVKTLTDKLNAPHPIALDQVRGYYRYLTHKDNPEKFQYDEKDIQHLNGFSILDFVELTKAEVNNIKRKLQHLIRELKILEYSDLMDYADEHLTQQEYDVASNNTYFFHTYISSRRNKIKDTYFYNTQKLAEEDVVDLAKKALK